MRKIVKLSLPRVLLVGVIAAAVCSTVTGLLVYHAVRPSGELAEVYDALNEAQRIVDSEFVGAYETDELRNYVLTGYASGLGDRWTSYMTPEYYADYLKSKADSTVGIGVTVRESEKEDGSSAVRIIKVAHRSPAEKAGIEPYDEIIAVGGKTIAEWGGYEKAIDAMLGEKGEQVTLRLRSYRTGEQETLTVTRQEYEQIHVDARMLDDSIGYIAIETFTDQTDEQLEQAIGDMQKKGAERLIFDLRNNPGGQLEALIQSLDPLLPKGNIISLKDKKGGTKVYSSDAKELDLPMAVLVNADSYSAAEFFAAALQEYGKAKIVGEKTVGKGYSQQGCPLKNGGCLNLSTHCYYTPKGESLIGKGVTPDVSASLSKEKIERFEVLEDAEDDQLQAAIRAVST